MILDEALSDKGPDGDIDDIDDPDGDERGEFVRVGIAEEENAAEDDSLAETLAERVSHDEELAEDVLEEASE